MKRTRTLFFLYWFKPTTPLTYTSCTHRFSFVEYWTEKSILYFDFVRLFVKISQRWTHLLKWTFDVECRTRDRLSQTSIFVFFDITSKNIRLITSFTPENKSIQLIGDNPSQNWPKIFFWRANATRWTCRLTHGWTHCSQNVCPHEPLIGDWNGDMQRGHISSASMEFSLRYS